MSSTAETLVCSVPPPAVVRVPPVTVALTSTVPPLAVMPPPALATLVEICKMPPPVASSRPVFVKAPLPLRTSVCPEASAFTVPPAELVKLRPPLPMTPYPRIWLSTFVSVKLPPFCCTYTCPFVSPLLSVTVPPPIRVTLASMLRSVLLPLPASSWTLPWLVMVPRSAVVLPRGPV